MCDFIAGRLILSHHRHDAAARAIITDIRERKIEHVSYIASMNERLGAQDPRLLDEFRFEQHLLGVPGGEEIWKANYLRFFYQYKLLTLPPHLRESTFAAISHSDEQLLIAPDFSLSLAQGGVLFHFDAIHHQYMSQIGASAPLAASRGVTVAVIDTGLDIQAGVPFSPASRAFHSNVPATVDDINGHGTVVASIIRDVAPAADLLIFKVGDGNPISEWTVLEALKSSAAADVVNMSLAFGMPFRNCNVCGRGQTQSSRSAIFEQTVDDLLRIRPEIILVSAAGNRQQNRLDFPARFGNVVAVGALDSGLRRPAYSNYGTHDQVGGAHAWVFFAPGGGNGEFVARTGATAHEGTSFAAAYATGLIARYVSQGAVKPTRDATLQHFAKRADTHFAGYTQADFGNGLIRG